jgi:NlpC/P60 family putative phage cell wall peptidase
MSAERHAQVVAAARKWLGTPYRHQASLKHVGCDCLGLLRGVWREVLGPEPETAGPYAPGWAEATGDERLLSAAIRHMAPSGEVSAGVVLIFRWRDGSPAKHIGIATSPDTFIHAQDGACVCEVALSPWWRRHLAGIFAFRN